MAAAPRKVEKLDPKGRSQKCQQEKRLEKDTYKQEGYWKNEGPDQKREGGHAILHLHDLTRPELHFTEPPDAQSKGSESAKLLAETRTAHSVPTVILGALTSSWMDVQGATGQTAHP